MKKILLSCIFFTSIAVWAEAPVVTAENFNEPEEAMPSFSTDSLTLAQRVERLEQLLANQSKNGNEIQNLQRQVQELQGRLEEANHQIQLLESSTSKKTSSSIAMTETSVPHNLPSVSVSPSQSADSNSLSNNKHEDLKKDISDVAMNDDTGSSVPGAVSTKNTHDISMTKATHDSKHPEVIKIEAPDVPLPGEAGANNFLQEQDNYEKAYGLIEKRQYSQAIAGMKTYLQQYPQGKYAGNAHYWLGEVYLLQHKSENARTEFKILMNKFPQHPKSTLAEKRLREITKSHGKL